MKDITDNKNIEDIVFSYRNINLPLRLVGLLGKSRMTPAEADEIDEFMVGWLRTTIHQELQKAQEERDTYWKERVEGIKFDIEALRGSPRDTDIEYARAITDVHKILDTLLDNLK